MVAAGDQIYASDVAFNVGLTPFTVDSATWNATESGSLFSVSASLVTGQQYWITLTTNVSADVAADIAQIRIREDNATGTQLTGPLVPMPTTSTSGFPLTVFCLYTAVATAAKTFVVTGQRNAGTGTAHRIRAGTSRPTYIRVDRIQ